MRIIKLDIANKKSTSQEVYLSSASLGSWHDLRKTIVKFREAQGLAQEDLAVKLGVTHSTDSQFESLSGNSRLMTLIAYAQALNLKLTFHASSVDEKSLITITNQATKARKALWLMFFVMGAVSMAWVPKIP